MRVPHLLAGISLLSAAAGSQGVMAGYDQKSNVVLSDSKERVYSVEDGVEEIPLGLYLVKGDQMCASLMPHNELDSHARLQSAHRRARRSTRPIDRPLYYSRRAPSSHPLLGRGLKRVCWCIRAAWPQKHRCALHFIYGARHLPSIHHFSGCRRTTLVLGDRKIAGSTEDSRDKHMYVPSHG